MENTAPWQALVKHYESLSKTPLSELLKDDSRNKKFNVELDNLLFDYSRQKANEETMQLLENLIKEVDVRKKVEQMFSGERINATENRAVLHVALRAPASSSITLDGKDVVKDVHEVLNRIEKFVERIRSGEHKGHSGKALTNYLVIGIGGSYLSIDFVHESLRYLPAYKDATKGRELRFIANVDPMDFTKAVEGLDPETTLVIVNSKTFTTAETMLNARTVRKWLLDYYKSTGADTSLEEIQTKITKAHVCAASTNISETSKFGIDSDNVFGFWDWVGGRFSVWSAIGVLPLSLTYGFDVVKQFLAGGHAIDQHFVNTKDLSKNIPLLLGAFHWYQISIGHEPSRAIIPYSEPLTKFVSHIQQLEMESNGKRVDRQGKPINYDATNVHYGLPGTNSQHSFFQALHQGRKMGLEFIGFCKNPNPIHNEGEVVSNHDELMSNFFAQQDALAYGRQIDELKEAKAPEKLWTAMHHPGDRPSSSLLFKELNAHSLGQLLAIYEHRTVVAGFLWDINSFDQYGVELGKILGKTFRSFFEKNPAGAKEVDYKGTSFNSSTVKNLEWYLAKR